VAGVFVVAGVLIVTGVIVRIRTRSGRNMGCNGVRRQVFVTIMIVMVMTIVVIVRAQSRPPLL
jgi:hypothetical protein